MMNKLELPSHTHTHTHTKAWHKIRAWINANLAICNKCVQRFVCLFLNIKKKERKVERAG